ncbi:MAG TPA: peptidase [Bacteroidales bacterium]|nr:peptidase [Bacteroidales bacterium]HBZ21959.1 peptidase [Bacteroidales bacterium]
MKNYPILIGFLLISTLLSAQRGGAGPSAPSEKKTEQYTLSGFRHGVSFFPKVKLSGVQYEPNDTLGFDRYHSLDVIYSWLEKWEKDYPDLVDLYEIGKSYESRPILQMTLTNRKTGKDTDKPAAFFEGGRHSGEVTGSESVMWMAQYLLLQYGKDPEVTHLLDTKTIYLKPVNNPDGHNLYLNTAQSNRSTVRPEDNDGDGLLDEDAPEDIDNDGMILTMRWKDEKKGNLIPDPKDSTGRIMKRVPAGKGIYLSSSEGIDNDGDGRINEDGIGGLDLHRNYPENWRPETELTGRGYTQGGSGEFPLSETETRAVVDFLLCHPNISVVNSMDTSVPMHLRPPSTSPSEERMYPEDLAWYKIFDDIGRKLTGYKKAGDVFNDYGDGSPLFGHGPDFGYWYYGAIWYGDEIWNGARFKDYNNDGDTNQIDMLIWDDEENGGSGFTEWKPARHPVYGDIEIGGFNPKFFSQNPPAKHLEPWIKNEAMFNIEMAMHLPEVDWTKIETKRIKAYRTDSADYQIKIGIINRGKLPTALKQAHLVKIVREDRIELEFDTTGWVKGKAAFKVIEEKKKTSGRSGRGMFDEMERSSPVVTASKNIQFTQGGSVTEALFTIRLYNRQELKGKASMFSTRGGVLKNKEFVIK